MNSFKKINLGNKGLIVPTIGLGCMGMTKIAHMDIYGQADEHEAIATIHRSLELGGNFLDTADLYGPLLNERLIAKSTLLLFTYHQIVSIISDLLISVNDTCSIILNLH